MAMRTLGDTGLPVSRIALGLAALGRPGYINLGHARDLAEDYSVAGMQAHTHAVLDAAWAGGVRYFDAARSYGRAEEFLGAWLALRQIAPGDVAVGSKWGYIYTAGWRVDAETHEVKEHSLPNLRRQWAESRANLGPWLRLYQIHSATFESGVLSNDAVLDELARLKERGIVAGLTLSGRRQADVLRRALEIERDGERLFGAVQATWNVLEPSAGPALADAHAAGMGVLVKEALANGRLTSRNPDPAFGDRLAVLQTEAARLGTSVDALALAAVLARPWAGVVLSGAAAVEQITSNLKALDVTWDSQAEAALRGLAEPPDVYWETRAALAWT